MASAKFSILVVDDRVENLVALEAALSELGQNIVKARSGTEALRQLLKEEFIVILLDVNMPDIDGFETAAMIRQRKKTEYTPIIFMTAATTSEALRQRGYSLGAVDYLFTPIEPEILRAKVAAFIDIARKADIARTQAEGERAAAERRAARFESRLQSLFNRLEVGIFRSTLDGWLVEANPALLKLLGLESVEQARELARRRDDGRSMQQLVSFHADGDPSQTLKEQVVELTQADGKAVHVSVVKTLSSDPDGERFVEGLVTDITKRKRAEDEREQLLASERAARSEAELANRLKDEFLATLSHELRTPLHAILGWVDVVRHAKADDEGRQLGVDAIKRNAQSQARLIDDLLDMNRIVSGKIRLNVRRVMLPAVIHDVTESLQPAAEAKSIVIAQEFEEGCPPVCGDSDRLQQIVWNLLSNAIKFTPRKGHVKVALARSESFVKVSVIDDGQGIRPDFLPHVFARFRQADASSTRQQGGLGLGLAIAKHLIEMHGGSISVHSEGVGKGARFDVLLPVAALAAEMPAAAGREGPPQSPTAPVVPEKTALRGVRVLVVDDVADARELMRVQLEECSAQVKTADSAKRALEIFAHEPPDVLVSDIGMPETDGYHLLGCVRALGADKGGSVPAVAVTAFARAEDRTRALESGFDDYLAKPVENWKLIQVVATLARRPRSSSREHVAGH